MTPPDIKRQRIRVSFHPILCCHSFFLLSFFIKPVSGLFMSPEKFKGDERSSASDRTQGQCGDQTKLHQVFPPRLCLSFFFFFFSFNQSSCSLMLPSLWARCQMVSIDVSAVVITKSIHRCLLAPAFHWGIAFSTQHL